MLHKACSDMEKVPCCILRTSVIFIGRTGRESTTFTQIEVFRTVNFKVTERKNQWLGSDLSVSGWQLQSEFMDCYKMTHIHFGCMEEVPYFFCGGHQMSRSNRLKIRFGSHLRSLGRSQLRNHLNLHCFFKLSPARFAPGHYHTCFREDRR